MQHTEARRDVEDDGMQHMEAFVAEPGAGAATRKDGCGGEGGEVLCRSPRQESPGRAVRGVRPTC